MVDTLSVEVVGRTYAVGAVGWTETSIAIYSTVFTFVRILEKIPTFAR